MSSANPTIADVEDVYELSPLQQGMLFHTLRDTGVGLYVNQAVYTLEDVDIEAFRSAWQQILDRHTILRTSFRWENLENPQQIVHRSTKLRFVQNDWRDLSPSDQEQELRNYLREEREQGFNLMEAPLLRISIFQSTDSRCFCVSSHHHILLDGWSNPTIMGEFHMLYEAARVNEQIQLPHPRPYSDYIRWLKDQDLGRAESFWRKYLHGIRTPTPLPADQGSKPRAAGRLQFGSWTLDLDESITQDLQKLARRCQVTINTLVQGAWAILLSQYTGQRDTLFGVLVSGRPPSLEGVESMVGMFLNTVPLRVRIPANESLSSWLRELKSQQVELQDYEYSSLMMVQSWSEIPRGTELFGSIVASKDAVTGNKVMDTSRPNPQGPKPGKARRSTVQQNYPLHLDISAGDTVELTMTYDARRFEAPAITRMMSQLRTLLEAMVENPDQRLGRLPVMSDEERKKVVIDWNETAVAYPKDLCLHQLFEIQAAKTPEATAVRCLEEEWTYADLNHAANRLAHHLRSMGIGPTSLVGLCIERSIDMVTALLAVLKAGAAYVPLDPKYPLERLKFMLSDARATTLVTQSKMLDQLPTDEMQVVCVDRDRSEWAQQSTHDLPTETDPEDLAYVLYTSGSTGTPKGVAIPHRVSVNRLHVEHDAIQSNEAFCSKTSLSFVDSIWELFSAWCHGLTVTLIPDSHLQDPKLLVDQLESSATTRIVLVPSLLRVLIESGIDLRDRLPNLRHWVASGEPLPADQCKHFANHMPNAVLTNLYGTSEVWDATRCDSRERRRGEPVPIGRPLGNLRAYVLDPDFNPLPVGIAGELYIGGEGLARGYWRRPDLTAENFVPDPFSESPGCRLYRTGDRARWFPDGNLEHLGRFDQQFKLRGFRIEPGDIEAVLRQHPDVQQAAVAVHGEEQLVGYVISDNESIDVAAVRQFAAERLPEHMSPTFYITLEKLPLTPSGKIDRRALPAPESKDVDNTLAKTSSRIPESELEVTIAEVWSGVLGVESIGADDNFFDLGGHSLSATRASARLGKALDKEIPLQSVFEAPTIASLAEWIEKDELTEDAPELTRAERGKEAPLSFNQKRLWVFDQINPGISSYTLPNTIRLDGYLNYDALHAALCEVARRHESLRTVFVARDGEPLQVVLPSPDAVPIPVFDLSDYPEEEREEIARRYAREQGRQPWDLEHGPLIRTQVLSLTPTSHILSSAVHHIISDGRSMGILGRELGMLYHAYSHGIDPPLPELSLQYADFAIWERQVVKDDLFQKQLNYWKETLADVEPPELPLDRPRPAVQSFRGAKAELMIPASVVDRLKSLAKQEQATMFMGLLAGFQLLVFRYTGSDDITVGTVMSNRSRVELEPLIGMFVNTVPLRSNFSGDPTFREILSRVKETSVGAFGNMSLPFEEMVGEIQPQRDLSRQGSPLFQIMFIHNAGMQGSGTDIAPGVSMSAQKIDMGFANFDFLLSTTELSDGRVDCTFVYNTDLFDSETIDRMSRHLELLFERAADEPDRRLSKISVLAESEKDQVLIDWNQTASSDCDSRPIHEIIRDHARSNPDSVAVVFENTSLTYGELNRRANQLAHRLVDLGIQSDSLVGHCLERGPEMIVGILGILKAGGAFVPMDSTYPPERLRFMFDDSQCSVVVSQQSLKDALDDETRTVVCLDGNDESISGSSDEEPPADVRPENLAYMIYTSGSTGTPKGVLVEHRNLSNIIQAQIGEFAIDPTSRVLQTMSLSFDAAVGEVFRALGAGATLCLARKEDLLPGPGMVQLLKQNRITATALSPTVLAAMPAVNGELPDLKTLTVGGEACPAELAARWGRGRRLINGYGPTETTIGATLAVNWDLSRKPPLGRPLANVRVFVLDRWMQPTPVGTPGELFISGAGVTRGYLNRPDLTAERFVPSPFGESSGERMYRTGDLVRWLPDGNLDFLGRIDQQVKIRGFRIELGEIESALQQHESVGQAVVEVRDERNVRRLVGYVTPEGNQKPSTSELRAFLKDRLPEYMVPPLFVVMDSLPLTTNGKVDRKSLPAPDTGDLVSQKTFVAPETAVEKTLAAVWTDVLGLERVGMNDNFFELGGDSILSIQVIARSTAAGVSLTPKDMFQYQTIAELAAIVGTSDVVVPEQGEITGDIPLTPSQRWFLEHATDDPHQHCQSLLVHAPVGMKFDLLQQAVNRLMEQHDALRAQFEQSDDGWRQVVKPLDGDHPVEHFDLAEIEDNDREEQIADASREVRESLNVIDGPLVRITWFDFGEQQAGRLLLVIHRLLVDTPSWPILVEDMRTIYGQLQNGQSVKLPPKTSSIQDWADALRQYSESDEFEEEIKYWQDARWHEVEALPTDAPPQEREQAERGSIQVSLGEEETHALIRELPVVFKAPVNDVLLTALAKTFSDWTNGSIVSINVDSRARENGISSIDLRRTVGSFGGFYPVLIDLTDKSDLVGCLEQVKEELRRVPNGGIGYSVLRMMPQSKENAESELFVPNAKASFGYVGRHAVGLSRRQDPNALARTRHVLDLVQETDKPLGQHDHLIRIEVDLRHAELQVTWNYSEVSFASETIDGVANNFIEILRELVARCQSGDTSAVTTGDFPLANLSQADLETLMSQLSKPSPDAKSLDENTDH